MSNWPSSGHIFSISLIIDNVKENSTESDLMSTSVSNFSWNRVEQRKLSIHQTYLQPFRNFYYLPIILQLSVSLAEVGLLFLLNN
jgi:hypothetical protein